MSPRIRAASAKDLAAINAVIEASKRHWNYPEDYLRAAIALLTLNETDLADAYVIEDGTVGGFFGIKKHTEQWTLDHLWIHPRKIGQGWGRLAIAFALRLARRNFIHEISVLPDPPAEGFYLKMSANYTGRKVVSRVAGGPVFNEMHFNLTLTLEPTNELELQRVLEAAPVFARRTTGGPVGSDAAREMLRALPPGKAQEDKFVFGIREGARLVGCADIIRAYPDHQTAWLGLLLIDESMHSRGVGLASYRELEKRIRAWKTARRIRLAVVATNEDAVFFWQKMGFALTGERKLYVGGSVTSEAILMEKKLGASEIS